MKIKVLRFSLATVIAAALVGGIALIPRTSYASGVKKVAKAFQAIAKYHVKSYQIVNGQRQLTSETWVEGTSHRTVLYGPDGKPLPNTPGLADLLSQIQATLKSSTPDQLLDPNLKDKLMQVLGGGANVAVVSKIYVNGKEVSNLPDEVKQALKGASLPTNSVVCFGGGETDLAYLRGLLQDDKLWDITPGQTLDGKTVDVYRIKGNVPGPTLYVDPATSLPVRLVMDVSLFGNGFKGEDDFDYTFVKP